jgi:hypothetical protein
MYVVVKPSLLILKYLYLGFQPRTLAEDGLGDAIYFHAEFEGGEGINALTCVRHIPPP